MRVVGRASFRSIRNTRRRFLLTEGKGRGSEAKRQKRAVSGGGGKGKGKGGERNLRRCFQEKEKWMDGWMDGWVDEWMDGWMVWPVEMFRLGYMRDKKTFY